MTTAQIICAVITIGTILLLFTKLPKGMSATLGALLMVLFQVTDFSTAFAKYSSSTVVIIVSMMMVGAALYETDMAAYLGHILTKVTGTSEIKLVFVTMIIACVLSAFLAPDSVFFMFLPLMLSIADAAKIPFPRLIYPFMTACIVGSYLTLIGSTANLNSNNMLVEMGYEGWGFFELLPSAIIQIIFLFLITVVMLKLNIIPNRKVPAPLTSDENFSLPEKMNPKMKICGGTLIVSIILMACNFPWLQTQVIAGLAAVVVIFTGCITFQKAVASVNWNIIFMMSGMTAIATCIQRTELMTPAVEYIGRNLEGNSILVCLVFFFVGAIGTQFMNNSAWVVVCTPIALALSTPLGIPPKALAGMCLVGSTSCMLTPMSTTIAAPVMEMSRFSLKELFTCGFFILISSLVSAIIWLVMFLL